jgi:predicted protein tyrosine phosphatase
VRICHERHCGYKWLRNNAQTILNFDVEASDSFEHLHIRIEDDDDANVLDQLEDAVEFIEEAIDDDGKVLVHCQAGVSRSSAVVVAFLCSSMGLGVDEALAVLKQSHPTAQPNEGFMQQLKLYKVMGYAKLHRHICHVVWRCYVHAEGRVASPVTSAAFRKQQRSLGVARTQHDST